MARKAIFFYTLPAISKKTLSGSSLLKIKDADREEVFKIFNLLFNDNPGPVPHNAHKRLR